MENGRCSPNLLFIMQEFTIYGRTRIQKYGFHIYQQYGDKLGGHNFYSDWKPYHFGPFSENLARDLETAISNNYVKEEDSDKDSKYKQYSATLKGRKEYRRLFDDNAFLTEVHELLTNLQHRSMMGILKQIYRDYPEYSVRSQIRQTVIE